MSLVYYIQINMPYSVIPFSFDLLLSHLYILVLPIGYTLRDGVHGRIVKRGLTTYFSMDFQGAFFVYLTLGLIKMILMVL